MTKKLDVEEVRGEISHHISPAVGWLRLEPLSEVHMKKYLERVQLAAEAIVEMANESDDNIVWEYHVIETNLDSGHSYPSVYSTGWSRYYDNVKAEAGRMKELQREYIAMRGKPSYAYSIARRPQPPKYEIIEEL